MQGNLKYGELTDARRPEICDFEVECMQRPEGVAAAGREVNLQQNKDDTES